MLWIVVKCSGWMGGYARWSYSTCGWPKNGAVPGKRHCWQGALLVHMASSHVRGGLFLGVASHRWIVRRVSCSWHTWVVSGSSWEAGWRTRFREGKRPDFIRFWAVTVLAFGLLHASSVAVKRLVGAAVKWDIYPPDFKDWFGFLLVVSYPQL